jgi:ADP-ribose pyrophosphatase YjhB (NUDIX family)
MQNVRIITTSRAVIVHNEQILLVSADKECWYTPGGWLDGFESLDEACKREVYEELGMEVDVGDVIKVAHYKVAAENNAPYFENVNKIEHYFLCTAKTMPKLNGEDNLWIDEDNDLIKHAKWFDINNLEKSYLEYNIRPLWLRTMFANNNKAVFQH